MEKPDLKDVSKLLIHPNNWDLVVDQLPQYDRNPVESIDSQFIGETNFYGRFGIPIHISKHVPEFATRQVWVPPSGPYWEMEQRDEEWAAPLGFGHYVAIDERAIFAMRDKMIDNLTKAIWHACECMEGSLEKTPLTFRGMRNSTTTVDVRLPLYLGL